MDDYKGSGETLMRALLFSALMLAVLAPVSLAAERRAGHTKLAITHISEQRRVGYSYGFDLCLSPTRSLEVEGLQMAQHRRTPS